MPNFSILEKALFMQIILAPMEGVVDDVMRDLLSQINPYDLVVTEFVRVVDQVLPDKVFYRLCPELKQGGKTTNGTPVRVQLLGQHPEIVALNAKRAIDLGSQGVDINFGCPAKMVNRSNGGAVLLQYPEQIYNIVKAMRDAIEPAHIVSAKVRLGFDDKSRYLEIAHAVAEAGANEIAVHARSKVDGYKAPAYWEYITNIRHQLAIPVIANGEIWNNNDAEQCMAITGCDRLMVGRGAISLPNLAATIKHNDEAFTWSQALTLMLSYSDKELSSRKSCYYPGRIKQWFSYLNRQYPEARDLFRQLRIHKDTSSIITCLNQALTEINTKSE